MGKFLEKEVERLSKINWQSIRDDGKISNLILVKEYLRRAALFIRTCNISKVRILMLLNYMERI